MAWWILYHVPDSFYWRLNCFQWISFSIKILAVAEHCLFLCICDSSLVILQSRCVLCTCQPTISITTSSRKLLESCMLHWYWSKHYHCKRKNKSLPDQAFFPAIQYSFIVFILWRMYLPSNERCASQNAVNIMLGMCTTCLREVVYIMPWVPALFWDADLIWELEKYKLPLNHWEEFSLLCHASIRFPFDPVQA